MATTIMQLVFIIIFSTVNIFILVDSSVCTGNFTPSNLYRADWTVEGNVVRFEVTVLRFSEQVGFWAALGFTTQTSGPFMVQYYYFINALVYISSTTTCISL